MNKNFVLKVLKGFRTAAKMAYKVADLVLTMLDEEDEGKVSVGRKRNKT